MVKSKREHHHKSGWFNKFYKSYWFILWFFIYGILFYISTLLVTALGIQNYYFQIIAIGIIISIVAKAISSQIHDFTFKLNFNLFVWTLVYILLLFGLKFLVSLFTLNQWLEIIIIILGLLIFIHLFKKFKFRFLATSTIIISIIFLLIILFGGRDGVSVFDKMNLSSLGLTLQKSPEEKELAKNIELCKSNLREEMRTLQIKSPIAVDYSIIEYKTFTNKADADAYKSQYSTANISDVCYPKSFSKDINGTIIIGIVVETRIDPNATQSILGVAISKETSVYFCDAAGNPIRQAYWCN